MPARAAALDNEAGDFSMRLFRQIESQRGRGDDRHEVGSLHGWRFSLPEFPWIERNRMRASRVGASHVHFQADRFAGGQRVQHRRNVVRDARSHQHIIDLGQHRPVNCGQGRKLNLLHQVHPDDAGMIFPRQKDLDEVRGHQKIAMVVGHIHPAHGRRSETFAYGRSAGHIIPFDQRCGDVLSRKMTQRPEHVTARVALLQAPGQDNVQARPRNHTEMTHARNRCRQAPIGNTNTHPTLDESRKRSRINGHPNQPNNRSPSRFPFFVQ